MSNLSSSRSRFYVTTHANINNTFDIYWVRITGFGNLARSQIRWFF